MNWLAGGRRIRFWILLCCLAMAGMTAHGGTASAQSAGRLYSDARDLYLQGDSAAAVANLKSLIVQYPASSFARRAKRDLKAIAVQAKNRERARRALRPQGLSAADDLEDSLSVPKPTRKLLVRPARRLRSAKSVPVLKPPAPKRVRNGAKPAAAFSKRALPVPKRARRKRVTLTIRRQSLRRRAKVRLGDAIADRVFFGDGVAKLGARASSVLAIQAAWLKKRPGLTVTVAGYADDAGSATYNNEIARQRAQAVRDRLIKEGVDAGRITLKAFGKDRPIALCKQAGCAAQNRRAITSLSARALAQIDGRAKGRASEDRSPPAVGLPLPGR